MFADGVKLDATWEDLAREDIRNSWKEEPADDVVADWVEEMQHILHDIQPGERYVILDGAVIPADATGAEFEGWYARHDLDSLPHIDALTDDTVIPQRLANMDYWQGHALEDRE